MDIQKLLEEKLRVGGEKRKNRKQKKKEKFARQVKVGLAKVVEAGNLKYVKGRKYEKFVKKPNVSEEQEQGQKEGKEQGQEQGKEQGQEQGQEQGKEQGQGQEQEQEQGQGQGQEGTRRTLEEMMAAATRAALLVGPRSKAAGKDRVPGRAAGQGRTGQGRTRQDRTRQDRAAGKDRGGKLYQREVRRKRRPESFLKLEKFLAERVMIIEDRVVATKEESREDVKVVENMETEESEAADEETDMETEESDKETEDSDMEMEDRQDGLEDTASETELEFDSDDDSD